MSILKTLNLILFFTINSCFYHNIFSFGCSDHDKPDVKPLETSEMKLICYYGSWSVYRPGNGKFPVENIDPFLCSHLIYSFAGLGYDYRIKSLDPYYDLKENYGKGAFERFNNLKNVNKNLKTLIAIGGWNEGSIKYSNMASQPEARKIFIDSVVNFIEKYGFDGLDLDWEYPASRGGKPEDKNNYVALLRELKEAFTPRGYLLTAAVSAGKWFIDPAYDIPQVSQYLDIINIMCYDYHGGWENKTGHNSPVYPRPDELDPTDRLSNVNFSINYWISRGAPRSKIVMGMGTYGRSFTLQKADMNGLNAPAPQKGQAGPYTREAGSLGYNEICEMRLTQTWTEVRDPYYLAPYIYKERQWVGYDDVESITIKAEYIKAMQLAGGMIWSVETDDFAGRCGPKYPLLNAIQKTFKSAKVNMPMPGAIETEDEVPSSSSSAPSSTQASSSWTWTKPTMSTQPWVWVRPSTSTSSPSTSTSSSTTTTQSPQWSWSSPSTSSVSPSMSTTTHSTSTTTPSTTTSGWPSWASSQWPWASSSSTTRWPWAATHPTSGVSTSLKPESSSTTEATNNSTPDTDTKKFVCQSAGMFRHPNDCQKFYRCVQTQKEGTYSAYEYKCPDRTVFNTKTNLCDWWKNVTDCPQNGTRNTRTNRF